MYVLWIGLGLGLELELELGLGLGLDYRTLGLSTYNRWLYKWL